MLREFAAFVQLPQLAPRCKAEIRADGRDVETFDRLRLWTYAPIGKYRCGPRETRDDVVARALAIAAKSARRDREPSGRRHGERVTNASIPANHDSICFEKRR